MAVGELLGTTMLLFEAAMIGDEGSDIPWELLTIDVVLSVAPDSSVGVHAMG